MNKFNVGDVVKTACEKNSIKHGIIPKGFVEEIVSVDYIENYTTGYVLAGLPDFWFYWEDLILV